MKHYICCLLLVVTCSACATRQDEQPKFPSSKDKSMRNQRISIPLGQNIHELRGYAWPKTNVDGQWATVTAIQEPSTIEVVMPSGKRFIFYSTVTMLSQKDERVDSITLGPMKTNGAFDEAMTAIEMIGENCGAMTACEDYQSGITEWRRAGKFAPRRVITCEIERDVSISIEIMQPDSKTAIWVWQEIYVRSIRYPNLYFEDGSPRRDAQPIEAK